MGNWTLETIDWDRFDASKVDPEILRNIKAAALVERNGGDYRIYLNRVFADDPVFIGTVDAWAAEEVQHGMALGGGRSSPTRPGTSRSPLRASAPATSCRSTPPPRCAAARPAR